MRSYLDCVHCYLKQGISCMMNAGIDEDTQYKVIYQLMDYVKTYNNEDSPALNSSRIYLKIYEDLGIEDPYKEVKQHSNDLALKLYPRLKDVAAAAEDGLYEALKISVAGNIIDLGIQRSFDIEAALSHSLETGFSVDHYERFKEKLANTEEILILGDNAGEIVFDRILVEELNCLGKKVTYAVKEGPVLNDATLEDALYVGMDQVARVITNGTNYLGTCLEKVSLGFREEFDRAQLMIAKGHANFEELEGKACAKDRIFFLLKIKCDCVAKVAGAKTGDVVFFTR